MLYIVGTQIDTRVKHSAPQGLTNKSLQRKITWLPPGDIWELASIRRNHETGDVEYSFMSWKDNKVFKTIPFKTCEVADQTIAAARNETIVDEPDRSNVDVEEKEAHLNALLNPKPRKKY